MRSHRIAAFAVLAPLVFGCVKPKEGASDAGSSAIATVDAAALYKPAPVRITGWGKDVNFKAPDSVIHDTEADSYFVSNVDGKPLDADKKGFISKVHPENVGLDLKWIESGKNKVVLNAPKGMALTSDTLWVADIDTVRLFDRKTGKPTGDVPIPGATSLTDIVIGPDGDVVVADAGLKQGASGLEPSGTDAIYSIGSDKKTVKTLAKGDVLKNPSSLLTYKGKLWMVSATTNDLAFLNVGATRSGIQRLNGGQLDGIVQIAEGDVFLANGKSNEIDRGAPGSAFNQEISGLHAPTGLGYDAQRKRLLVVLSEENEMLSYQLK